MRFLQLLKQTLEDEDEGKGVLTGSLCQEFLCRTTTRRRLSLNAAATMLSAAAG